MLRHISIFLLLVTSNAMGSNAFTLTSEKVENKEWSMQYNSKSKEDCKLKFENKISKLNRFECQKIEKLFREFKKEKSIKIERADIPLDASVYEIKTAQTSSRLLLQAPKVCEIEKTGSLKCKEIALNPTQQLLLDLLFFKEAKF